MKHEGLRADVFIALSLSFGIKTKYTLRFGEEGLTLMD